MRARDIVVGETYRLKDTLEYGYVKVLDVLYPKEKENTKPYIIVKVEHTVCKNDSFGFIRYFKPSQIIKEQNHEQQ